MRVQRSIPILIALLALAMPAAAEQIINFTNGTSMPIRSHEIRGDMVHIDLGGDAFMAFPYDKVESIVEAGKNVLLPKSTPANQMQGDPARASTTLKAAPTIERANLGTDNSIVERNGVTYHTPFADSRNPVKRSLGIAGNARAREAMRQRSQVQIGNQPTTQGRTSRTVIPGYRQKQLPRGGEELTTIEFQPKNRPQPATTGSEAGAEGGAGTQQQGGSEGGAQQGGGAEGGEGGN